MTGNKREQIEVVTSKERRRRWAPAEKKLIVQETYEPGVTVSLVARRHGIAPNQLFYWRRRMEDGALTAVGSEEKVIPESQVRELEAKIRRLEREKIGISKIGISNRLHPAPRGAQMG